MPQDQQLTSMKIDISASGPQTEEHKNHREEVMYYFINRANTAKNLWTTCDIIFKTKTNRTKSDQELSNGKSKKEKEKGRKKERKKEEDSKIEEAHDKLLL